MFISHNLAIVHYLSDRIGVMYLGEIVEEGDARSIYKEPYHPYTRALISSTPAIYREKAGIRIEPVKLVGEPPSPVNPPKGCRLHPRCPFATSRCREEKPELVEVDGRKIRCWLYAKR